MLDLEKSGITLSAPAAGAGKISLKNSITPSSLVDAKWFKIETSGSIPSPRTSHNMVAYRSHIPLKKMSYNGDQRNLKLRKHSKNEHSVSIPELQITQGWKILVFGGSGVFVLLRKYYLTLG